MGIMRRRGMMTGLMIGSAMSRSSQRNQQPPQQPTNPQQPVNNPQPVVNQQPINYDSSVGQIIFNSTQINDGIQRAANWMSSECAKSKPLVIGLGSNSIPFYGLLTVKIRSDMEFNFIKQPADLKLFDDSIIAGKEIILVSTMFSNQSVIKNVSDILKSKKAKNLRVVSLLKQKDIKTDFSSLMISQTQLVGFGLTFQQFKGNLPYIAVINNGF